MNQMNAYVVHTTLSDFIKKSYEEAVRAELNDSWLPYMIRVDLHILFFGDTIREIVRDD